MAMTISGDNGLTFPAGSTQVQAGNFQTMVNRIINGRMEIDQRNAGASVSNDGYAVDRFNSFRDGSTVAFTSQRSTTVPSGAGFINSLLITTTTSGTAGVNEGIGFQQRIEGFNVADLMWGTANAKTVTLSFWVRSSLTGTFGGALQNSAANRSYPYTFTISSANTFEYKTITIAGDTSGTWLTDNGIGIRVYWDMGSGTNLKGTAGAWVGANNIGVTGSVSVVGTNGATFYITGVDLRVGSYTVVPQDFRAYGTELALCQRYFVNPNSSSIFTGRGNGSAGSIFFVNLPVPLRATPSITSSGTAQLYSVAGYASATATFSSVNLTNTGIKIQGDGWSGGTDNRVNAVEFSFTMAISAEL